ncbi:OsmC family protein [[Mycoplasma] testudinis]|uniref:OsmC family protein n=1 Tax=[Mycoplasma] testudinis TaxID=33924 RepID=UPI000488E22C|nr:OsmC family protein [[Mycoplasma] testudinis]
MSKVYVVDAKTKASDTYRVQIGAGTYSGFLKDKKGIPLKLKDQNPEQLLAAGFALCFGKSLSKIFEKIKIKLPAVKIRAVVELHFSKKSGFKLQTGLDVVFSKKITQEQAEIYVKKAEDYCPYAQFLKASHFAFLKVNGKKLK